MSRVRLVVLVVLSSAVVACSLAPTSPQQPRVRPAERALLDDDPPPPPPCDTLDDGGWINPNGRC